MSKKLTKEQRDDAIKNQSVLFRGHVIERSVELEAAVNGYIMAFFHKDIEKRVQLAFYLLDRMYFDAKISVFQSMLQTRFDKEYKRQCEKMMSKIRFVKDERNIFAHYLTNYRLDAPKTGVSYFKLRNQVDFVNYDNDKLYQILERIEDCIIWIEVLTNGI